MTKRLLSLFIFLAYCALLIKVMVFKNVPTIKIGGLMLNFGGIDAGHSPNFVPFRTILPYLLGYKGLIIAGINLIGNIALLVPIGFLIPLFYPNMTWKKSLILAVASGLAIETMQVVLRVGIFDIDDVILNALGVMIGHATLVILTNWIRSKSYKKIVITVLITLAAAAAFYSFVVYPITHQPVNPEAARAQTEDFNNSESTTTQKRDLCGNTRGTGEIISKGHNTITIKRNDGALQSITLTDNADLQTPAGRATQSDLNIGDRATIVIDQTETAAAVLVCGIAN